jgi:isopropylmalate/homocitrate/citramalate synthase
MKTKTTIYEKMSQFGPRETHRTVSYEVCSKCKSLEAKIQLMERLLKKYEAQRVFYGDENNWEGRGSCNFTKEDLEDYVSEEYHSEIQQTEWILERAHTGDAANAPES